MLQQIALAREQAASEERRAATLRSELQPIQSALELHQQQVVQWQDRITAAKREFASEEERAAKLRSELQPIQSALELHQQVAQWQDRITAAKREFASEEERAAKLRKELLSIEESLDIQAIGLYHPRYGFETSDEYSARLATIREEQKSLVKLGRAAHCDKKWTVDGNAKAGQKMIDEQIKLMLRAFNGECDAAIAKVKYDNVVTLELRITKSYEDLNKLGRSKHVAITGAYRDLRLAELRLVHEHREKLQAEKEEQRRIKEQMRDEQKAQQEIERAQAEAEKEAAQNQRALEKARAELAAATAKEQEKLAELERQIRDAGALEKARAELAVSANKEQERLAGLVDRLETELSDAIDRKAKAIARAQLTRSGHVYVLSNVGSFGDGIYKIGLTRRLDPFERVEELGDASVPFGFDVHAIIYAVDAPALESALHREFANHRVNRVNTRKEYFRVSLDEIRAAVEKHHGLVTFVLSAEAQEYRKTCALAAEAGSPEAASPT